MTAEKPGFDCRPKASAHEWINARKSLALEYRCFRRPFARPVTEDPLREPLLVGIEHSKCEIWQQPLRRYDDAGTPEQP
jgi:hypothetical protein